MLNLETATISFLYITTMLVRIKAEKIQKYMIFFFAQW